MISKMILHVDLDAFFASVEILDNPELKGKPLIVGGLPGERRSVVSTCSYEARKYGVHSAMPISRAYELCPQAVFLHGRMERYHEMSQQVMAVFREYSPDVMQMSIDEAFIDITGTELLFGDPVTLSKDLKKKVLERTGLTVSVGIATNRYVAKIASGLKKPDGLCYVPAGYEEKFMLSLPLDKLWGIGTKSRERLNACGIFTIPEIHAISETALKELFGEASGSFLYRSVRGMDVEHFGDETKSRSMSAERTFCFDLSDIYSIETELLHLSYDVMLRVLKEKVNSKTVCLKIRYEDFTTVTVTESSTRIVSSIEDLFERSCRLFHKKYENGRGIRLLGLGLQNISDGLESSQGELFDFGEKKQRSVEKTVLKLHQKDPTHRLKKARQLITKACAFFFLLSAIRPVFSQSETEGFHLQNLEYEVEGSWESVLSSDTTLILGGTAPSLSIKPPVFSQKADLLLWFMYDNHWYFDASVSMDSDQNTVAAGYLGDGIIQEIRVGTDIGSDIMSPGFRINLQGDNWDASAKVHLDSVNAHSKTWKGSAELVSSTTPISSYKTGFLFSVPESSAATSITGILVEDESGAWKDSSGRRYKRLSSTEYLVMPAKGLIYLEIPVNGSVIAETSSKSGIEAQLPSFLEDVYDWFGDRGYISTYVMMGLSIADEDAGPSVSETSPLFTSVTDGSSTSDGLYLSKSGYFSPFQVASFYTRLSQGDASVSVDSKNLYAEDTDSLLLEKNTSLIQLHSTAEDDDDFSKASTRFPAAKLYPWIYLPSSGITDDIVPLITETISSSTDSFSIGSNAMENTIQVLKNGTPVPAFYDKTSGTVTLAAGYSESDTITISWSEYSSQSDDMKLTVSADFNAEPTPYFKTSASLSSLLSFDSDTRKLSSVPEAEPVIAGTLSGIWNRSFGNFTLSASNTISSRAIIASDSREVPLFNITGTGSEEIWFLEEAAKSKETPELTQRPTATQTLPDLSDDNACTLSLSGSRKAGTSGLNYTIEGTLSQNDGTSPYWYAVDIPLSSGKDMLSSAHEYSFSITDLKKQSSDYDIYLQLGKCTWLISSSQSIPSGPDVLQPFKLKEDNVQTVRVLLSDSDRMKLEKDRDMRLVFVNKSSVSDTPIKVELSGRKEAASGISFNIRAENSSGHTIPMPVSVTEDANNQLLISWDTASAAQGDTIIVERCFPSVSADRYQNASIELYIPTGSAAAGMKINLLSQSDEGFVVSETFDISESELAAFKGKQYTLTKALTTDAQLSKIQFVIDAKPSESGYAEIHAGTVYLLDPLSSLTISDEATASINWTSGDVSASLSADATGAGISYPSLSGTLDEKDVSSSVRASFASPLISVSGQGAFDLLGASLLSGEYLVETEDSFLSGVIGLSETFRWNEKADSVYRKDSIFLSFEPLHIPFTLEGTLETDDIGNTISENALFTATSSYKVGETSFNLKVSQSGSPENTFSYFGNTEAQRQTESAVFTQKLSLLNGNFTPSLDIGLNASRQKKKSTDTGIFSQALSLPFTIGSEKFALSYSRETSAEYSRRSTQGTFTDDISTCFDAFETHTDALSVIPFYDLFQDNLGSILSSSLERAEGTSRSTYSATGAASWNRMIRGDWLDLIIPNATTISASRTLSLAGSNILDKNNNSLSLSFIAFNCLGASSSLSLFDWYDQDEFQYTFKITEGTEPIKAELTGYCTLYFIDDASLTTFYSGLFTKTRHSHTLQCSWNRPATIFEKPATRITTGAFGINKSDTAKNPNSNVSISHKANINITDLFTVSGSAAVAADIKEVTNLNITLSIGGKIQF